MAVYPPPPPPPPQKKKQTNKQKKKTKKNKEQTQNKTKTTTTNKNKNKSTGIFQTAGAMTEDTITRKSLKAEPFISNYPIARFCSYLL